MDRANSETNTAGSSQPPETYDGSMYLVGYGLAAAVGTAVVIAVGLAL
jgi:hypothetical protein